MKKMLWIAGIMVVVSTVFYSCQKEDENQIAAENAMDEDEVAALFEDVFAEIEELSGFQMTKSEEALFEGNSGTRTVTSSLSGDTVVRVITYVDFVHPDALVQRVKNGTVTIKIQGRHHLPVFVRTITFKDFRIDDNKIEGIKVIEKTDNFQFTMTLTNGKVIFSDGKISTREMTRVRKQTAGTDTPFVIWDDEFTFEGTTTGINRKGQEYVHTILTPLLHRRNCRWIVSGNIEFNVDDKKAILDYGEGECDNTATVTIGENTKIITLGRKKD
jgi:hypothetical protein